MRRICWSRNVFSERLKTTIDVIAGYAREVSSRREDRRNRTHVDNSLTCCGEENSKILGWQNVVDGVRQHPQPELYWFYVLTPYVSLGQWRRQGEGGGKLPPYGLTSENYVICVCFHCHGTSSYHTKIYCKTVEQRVTLIHRQYNLDWGISYSRPPIDPYLTSPLLQNPGGATGLGLTTEIECGTSACPSCLLHCEIHSEHRPPCILASK